MQRWRSPRSRARVLHCLAWVLLGATAGLARAECESPAGHLLSAQATVESRTAARQSWQRIDAPRALCEGDIIAVRSPGRAVVRLADETLVRLDQNSTLHVLRSAQDEDTELGLLEGIIHVITRVRKRFGVATPFVNAMVEGTEFTVDSDSRRTRVLVATGVVRTANDFGSALLAAGEAAEASTDQGPRGIELRPLDALRWAIHYPQIVWHDEDQLAGIGKAQRDALTRAQQEMASARYAEALAALATNDPQADRRIANTRVAILLALGRVDQARSQIAARARDDDAQLRALDALVRVAQNEGRSALEAAREAVAMDPGSAAAQLALSYALQARGQLSAALDAAREASHLAPAHPFAWARRAELELSRADTAAARDSIERALALAPKLPRARALLAFAALFEGAGAQARELFSAAIEADPADPLPRFGRALAKVRAGEFGGGRQDLEIAVLLDPGNAELRAYLGRIYAAEERPTLAGKEFALARRLDPASPTPWQFDAFLRLRRNDPLGALAYGSKALELNDRRSVVRSAPLLDIDRALRSANLGSAHAELGFAQSMLTAAMDALADDPAGAAGHRLLADAYAERPRFETARVSELLKARLRQPVGRRPAPPQFVAAQIPLVGGPRALAPEEASDLFERGPNHFLASALAGSQSTRGASLLVARSGARAQAAIGHYRYRRDALEGGRDIELSGTRLEGQLEFTPATMLLAEVATSERRGGEVVPQLLAGAAALPTRLDQRLDRDSARLSLRHSAAPQHELLLTAAALHAREESFDRIGGAALLPFERLETDLRTRLNARQLGALYAFQGERYGALAGASSYRERSRTVDDPSFCCLFGPEPVPLGPATETRRNTEHNQLFASLEARPIDWARIYVGASYDVVNDEAPVSLERVNGKLAARMQLSPASTARVAVIQGTKGPKYNDESLEPAQFAGFNQVFDDLDGTRWQRDAAAFEHRFGNGGGMGAELSRRRLEVPALGCFPGPCRGDWDERLDRAYLEWPLGRQAAISAAWHFERLQLQGDPANSLSLPHYVRTETLPFGLWLRPAPRLATRLEVVRVRQRAAIADGFGGIESRAETRWLANARLKYARTDQRMVLSLAVHNLFDRRIALQNTDLDGNPRIPLFHPERSVVLQASLRF